MRIVLGFGHPCKLIFAVCWQAETTGAWPDEPGVPVPITQIDGSMAPVVEIAADRWREKRGGIASAFTKTLCGGSPHQRFK